MDFGKANRSVNQADIADPFHFSPCVSTVQTAQSFSIPDTPTACDRFNMRNFSKDCEIHFSSSSERQEIRGETHPDEFTLTNR
jgi:hypothetical protein